MSQFEYSDFGIEFKLPESGFNANTFCPKCKAEHPKNYDRKCLSVHVIDEKWKCHRCGWAGGLAGGEKGSRRSSVVYLVPKALEGLSEKHRKYLCEARGLNPDVIDRMGIFSKGDAMAFPYHRKGEVVNIKYRTLDKKMWTEAGAEMIPYGMNNLAGSDTLFLVEGEIDLLTFLTYHKEATIDVLSVSNGVNSGDNLVNVIKGKLPKKIYLAFDNDDPGNKLADSLATQLGRERCWRVRFPNKDINGTWNEEGTKGIDWVIKKAKPYHSDGIFQIEDVADDILDYYDNGRISGIKLGWPSLDEFYSVKTSYWTIVTGVPHSGKSGFVDQIVLKLIRSPHDWKFAICSPENQPVYDHYVQLLEKITGKPFVVGQHDRMTKADIHQAIEFINDKIFMVLPERDGEQRLTIHNVLEEFEKLRGQHGCKGYVIDPFNEMSHCRPPGQSQTEYVGEWISLVRRFCRVNNVHTWVVAHPRKFDVKNDNVGHGQDTPVVRPSDIEDSRFWWSKGDNILSIWRSQLNPTDEVTVHIQKIKPRYVGRQGSAILRYDKVSGSYSDPLNP